MKSIKILLPFILLGTFGLSTTFAFGPKETAAYFNGPTVKNVTETTADISLSKEVLSQITEEEKTGVYFEYYETHKACIMIYPTPQECLPKKTEAGKTEVTLTNLKPNTSYTILYKRDNTIRCITTPCPENGFESMSVEFVTKHASSSTKGVDIYKNVRFGNKDAVVAILQQFLKEQGYLTAVPTGYFGVLTLKAVKEYQKSQGVPPTGYVGELTRKAMRGTAPLSISETFEGTIESFSTDCFFDGECSVTVSGKRVVITKGWAQGPVGILKGVPSIGDLDKKIGAQAKVYAKKIEGGYTLYGSSDYYVEVK